MIGFVLAALLSTTSPQDAAAAQAEAVPEQPVRLEDIEVTGRSLKSTVDKFVATVAAPNSNRSLARWRDQICISATDFGPEEAQHLVDRISGIAGELGLRTGSPRCSPNVLIVAAHDPDSFARDMVQRHERAMRFGGLGMDRGRAAFTEFQTSNSPVRWWQVSMPVNAETGERATRIPGECKGSCGAAAASGDSIYAFAPTTRVFAPSRLSTQIVDDIFRVIIIVDTNQIAGVQPHQLADYIAMVAFAQIDPTADTSRYASILNVFADPDSVDGMTDWDKAYLNGLYAANRTRLNLGASRTEIASSIMRAHENLRAEYEDQD